MAAMIGVDPVSDGLARAARMGVATSTEGIGSLTRMPDYEDIRIVFDGTSADARDHSPKIREALPQGVIRRKTHTSSGSKTAAPSRRTIMMLQWPWAKLERAVCTERCKYGYLTSAAPGFADPIMTIA
ncbi:hypothetical protein [Shinella sp. NM-101]|uniref:hypothetical protein n=1 Tax=Shinella sp. NM-101 TaxID=2744455 RepID=UPI00272A1E01|nr:hypothetical protein [Shinella sp. NM-101]